MLNIFIKKDLFSRPRKLDITTEFVEYENPNHEAEHSIKFMRGEITSLQFGVEFIKGYIFSFGRTYCINIKGLDEKIIKIRMTSVYGVNRKVLQEKFNIILNAFFETHHRDMVQHYLAIINTGTTLNLNNTLFNEISIGFDNKDIHWHDLGLKAYFTYFALYSKSYPKIYTSYNYLNDWNASVIYSLSKAILLQKGITE